MKKIILFTTIILLFKIGFSQDQILTNTLTNPLYTNPAFAGSKEMVRTTLTNQLLWNSAIQNYTLNSFSTDFNINKIGVGASSIYSLEGNVVKNTDFDFALSYKIGNLRKFIIRPGIKFSYLNRSLDWDKLIFYDQLNVYDGVFTPNSSANYDYQNVNIFDFSAGFVCQFPIEIRRTEPAWINLGFAAHHLPKHDLTFVGISENIYPKKYAVHGGIFLPLYFKDNVTKLRTKSLINLYPNFKYQIQGKYSAIDLGLTFYRAPFTIGLTARGFQKVSLFSKNQLILNLGYEANIGEYLTLQIMYSADYAVTGASHAKYSATFLTHEFSLHILFANKRKSDCSTKLDYNFKRWYNNNEMQQRQEKECPPGKTPRRKAIDTRPMFYPFELPQTYVGF